MDKGEDLVAVLFDVMNLRFRNEGSLVVENNVQK
jgi:hypothetical protein